MATPRHQLVDSTTPLHYHLSSRCVRRSVLCGYDPVTGIDYSHRKTWLIERLEHLGTLFAVEIDAYAIMSNHFHLVVYYNPLAADAWTDEEVAYRWVEAFPPKHNGAVVDDLKPLRRQALLDDPARLKRSRRVLGSLSEFMKHLKQPIAYRANREDHCTGHFFEGRFYSGVLLDEEAVLAAMAYVDLNPVRAKIAKSIEQCQHTSIDARLKAMVNRRDRLEAYLAPLISGTGQAAVLPETTLRSYMAYLELLIRAESAPSLQSFDDDEVRWIRRVSSMSHHRRAYGGEKVVNDWYQARGWRSLRTRSADIL